MTLTVAVDARSAISPEPRGEGKSLLRLYREIAAIRPNWRFVFFGVSGRGVSGEVLAQIPRASVYLFDLPGFRFNTWENIGLPLRAWRAGAQVLHCAGSSCPRYSPIPVVMTVHDVIPLVIDDGLPAAEIAKFSRQIQFGLRSAKGVIAVSHNTSRDLARLFPWAEGRIRVIHWGGDVLPEDQSTHSERYVLAFGGGARRKNTTNLLKAFWIASQAVGDVRLKIVGINTPALRQTLLATIDARGLGSAIDLLSFVNEAQLDALYRNAYCLLYPSLYEGFGVPLLEAMGRGVPVIASASSSIPEVVGDAALMTNPTDPEETASALIRLLSDGSLWATLKKRSREQCGQFSWRVAAESTARVLEMATCGANEFK